MDFLIQYQMDPFQSIQSSFQDWSFYFDTRSHLHPRDIFTAMNFTKKSQQDSTSTDYLNFHDTFISSISCMGREIKNFLKKELPTIDCEVFWKKCEREFPYMPYYEELKALSKKDLKGTVYFEVIKTYDYADMYKQPKMKRWCEDSIYFTECAWFFIQPMFENNVEDYDYYGLFTVFPDIAAEIIVLLIEYRNNLKKITTLEEFKALYNDVYFFKNSKTDFLNWEFLVENLPGTIDSLVSYMTSAVKDGQNIVVSGI